MDWCGEAHAKITDVAEGLWRSGGFGRGSPEGLGRTNDWRREPNAGRLPDVAKLRLWRRGERRRSRRLGHWEVDLAETETRHRREVVLDAAK